MGISKQEIKLVRPNVKYKKSFLLALKEFKSGRSPVQDEEAGGSPADFGIFVKRLLNNAKGMDLPPGYVPESHYWLVRGEIYIGRVSIRHKLVPALRPRGGHVGYAIRPCERNKGYGSLVLKLALSKAYKLGIKKALLTCDKSNEFSRRIIEKNGGVLIKNDKVALPGTLRFWVPTGSKR